MILSEILDKIYQNAHELPGLKAHALMAPYKRPNAKEIINNTDIHPRHSAVCILMYQKNWIPYFCLIQRPDYDGTHSGQISFPGGKMEDSDQNLKQTAIRETHEEIGVSSDEINIIGELTDVYIPPSNFLVTPFIGFLDHEPTFVSNYEVDEIVEVKVSDLLNKDSIVTELVNTKYGTFKVPAFNFNDKIVWGATAVILSELKEILNR